MDTKRNNNIGIIHFIGALFVIYGHQYALMGLTPPRIFGSQIHSVGVKIIFLISGYLITKSLCSLEGTKLQITKCYLKKRIGRIYPEYLACLLFSAFLIGPIFSSLPLAEYFSYPILRDGIFPYIINNLRMYISFGLPNVFTGNPINQAVNGSLWTLPVEFALYFVLWLIAMIAPKKSIRKWILIALVLLTSLLSFLHITFFPSSYLIWYGTDWYSALTLAPYFLIGALCSQLDLERFLYPEIGALLVLGTSGISFDSVLIEPANILILSYIVLSLGFSKKLSGIHFRVIRCEYSYGIYLYAFPIQQCVIELIRNTSIVPYNANLCFVISTSITYFVAMLSYKLFFLPLRRMKWV